MKPVNLNQLLFHPKSACLSFYQTPFKDSQEEAAFDVFFEDMKAQLELQGKDALLKMLSKQRSNIRKVLKSHLKSAHGFFISETLQGYIILEEIFESFCMIGSSFHVRPLLEQMLVNPEFMIVNISLYDISVYKADFRHVEIVQHYEFDQVISIRDGVRLFAPTLMGLVPHKSLLAIRTVAHKVMESTQYNSYPVIVTGLEDMKKIFLKYFQHTGSVISHIEADFFEKSCIEILERCRIFKPSVMDFYSAQYKERLKRMIKSKKLLSDLPLIIRAATKGEIVRLILPVEKKLWGKIDLTTGEFEIHKRPTKKNPSVDILNELAEEVMRNGGKIQFLGPHFFPPDTNVMAILQD